MVVYKPARLLTAGDHSGDPHLLDWVKQVQASYLKEKRDLKETDSTPQPFVAPVHFLDRPVSGAVVFALSTKGASRLSAQFRERRIDKRYLAILEDAGGWLQNKTSPAHEGESSWEDWVDDVLKDPETNTVRVVSSQRGNPAKNSGPKPQRCELKIRTIRTIVGMRGLLAQDTQHQCSQKLVYRLVEIKLGTGRSHQIRVQCAHRGMPLVGDLKYGAKTGLSPKTLYGSIGLHAYYLGFKQPVGDQDIGIYAPVPRRWIQLFGEDFFAGFDRPEDAPSGPLGSQEEKGS